MEQNYEKLKLQELKLLATEREIEFTTKTTKEELVKLLLETDKYYVPKEDSGEPIENSTEKEDEQSQNPKQESNKENLQENSTGENKPEDKIPPEENQTPPEISTGKEALPKANSRRKKSYGRNFRKQTVLRKSNSHYLTIDGTGKSRKSQEREENKEKNEIMLEIKASLDPNIAKILTGTVVGSKNIVEDEEKGLYKCILLIDYKGKRIYIDSKDFFNLKEEIPYEKMRNYVSKRKCSQVDFVVISIYEDENGQEYIVASRQKAVKKLIKKFWYGKSTEKDKDGKNLDLIRTGTMVEARIVTTIKNGVWVEVFGVESFLPCKELSFSRIFDARIEPEFQTGKKLKLTITRTKKDAGKISFASSGIIGKENPRAKALREINSGDELVGRVENVISSKNKLVFFVNIGEIEVYCTMAFGREQIPKMGQMVDIRISDKNEETGFVWGIIIHNRPMY